MRSTTVAFLLILAAAVAAFSPAPRASVFSQRSAPPSTFNADSDKTTHRVVPLNMFNADGDGDKTAADQTAKPLEEATPLESTSATETTKAPTPTGMVVKNLGKGGEETELNFYDPTMRANVSLFQMEWWAYLLVLYPFILLLNDAFHFLPQGMKLTL